MRIYTYDLPEELHEGTIGEFPSQRYDFWLVEHLVREGLGAGAWATADPREADLFLIPFYPACYSAAANYRHGVDVARPGRWQRYRREADVLFAFGRAMRAVRRMGYFRPEGPRNHLLVFGQGRGANGGFLWRFHRREIERMILLGVEAKPYGDPAAFSLEKDIVIPGYTPWQDVIGEVDAAGGERDLLIHFRGRGWGPVRPRILGAGMRGDDVLVSAETPFAMGGENRPAVRADAVRYFRELRRSVFCLCPAGWTPWSKRIYESILCGAIPVFVPGDFVPPFRTRLDYSRFSVTIREEEIPRIETILRGIPRERVAEMLAEVQRVRRHFLYGPGGGAMERIREELAARI